MKLDIKRCLLLPFVLIMGFSAIKAQDNKTYTLQELMDSATANSHLLAIKSWQVREKMSKLKEDGIKRYPAASLSGTYQYNFSLPDLVIPAGMIGSVPVGTGGTQLLPETDTKLKLGQRSTYNIELSAYQPLLEQAKIKTGLDIDRKEIELSEKEKTKLSRELKLAVQKLYYGILIAQKQQEEASARLELAKAKLLDAETALEAGKTIGVNIAGLKAQMAEEQQNVLKQNILIQDYKSELLNVTNINAGNINIAPVNPSIEPLATLESYHTGITTNPDMQIALLSRDKALLGIKAAKQSRLPDIGLIGGYYYQKGNPLLPGSSPYVGINLKWNIQDLFSGQQVLHQREAQLKQSEYNIAYQQQQLNVEVDKAYRKINQAAALMDVAGKAVQYRNEELKLQEDKQASGLDIKTSMAEVKASLAKAEADYYAARLSYLLAIAELKSLTGSL
ncbi:TolC family protein [Chitinophaga tropicalis]|uniref:TolC family protein n=1 Tax=Chitinophaga tropicalis TaxID=2683588 RepID=A0A7K1U2X1_9BACT|nr:TolC family protein [Chitinophaga tropicalis]MVT08717.1 TolC family protein [Chitinophaga tropicalis]